MTAGSLLAPPGSACSRSQRHDLIGAVVPPFWEGEDRHGLLSFPLQGEIDVTNTMSAQKFP